ncbi:hypothetical protein MVEN_02159500 [Mycena venus]|uniref:Uncharacterized protein n=1 Tax=Mycena venus TaxID=2733690 RepID=A0A8H6X8X3_9AGAR|nr:hypothetical protein MVEN_02159500 [Mycena venus]
MTPSYPRLSAPSHLHPSLSTNMPWVSGSINSAKDIIKPKFRTINFEDGSPQVTVVTMARNAWTAKVPEDSEASDMKTVFSNWLRAHGDAKTDWGAPECIEQNPDKEDVESPWRQEILRIYNHLFYDLGGFLADVNCAMGTFHPPNHTFFTVNHDSTVASPAGKTFDTNILIIPAFLDKGVTVTVKRILTSEEEAEAELGSFSPAPRKSEQASTAWFIGEGVNLSFAVSVEGGEKREGVAAVFAVGILTVNIETAAEEGE